jgi:uncharacterized protein (DUF2235 family)
MRRLVVCADGTWNRPDQLDENRPAPTNVVKVGTAVLPVDSLGVTQVVAYHSGVGERGGLWDHLTGGAFGEGISRNILDLYRFLITNYAPGDEVWLFGFSRGAYAVRSLAGLLRNSGLLMREHLGEMLSAYALYRDRSDATHPDSRRARAFRQDYAWPAFGIRFIGVWDTVGALGIPVTPLRFWTKKDYEFHDVQLSRTVDFAYQALAIDEHRKPFEPAVWHKHPHAPPTQVLEQAWFPGVHSNVGGGYADTALADCALAWMWDRAEKAGLGLDPALQPQGNPDGEMRDSSTWFFGLLGDGTRVLGAKNGKGGAELPHRAALVRSGYGPPNLTAFLATLPEPPDRYTP